MTLERIPAGSLDVLKFHTVPRQVQALDLANLGLPVNTRVFMGELRHEYACEEMQDLEYGGNK